MLKQIRRISIIFLLFTFLSLKNDGFDINKYFINDWTGGGWAKYPDILKNIKEPQFRNKDYNILDFGASKNGISDSGKSINKAIEACSLEGGGRVIIPPGIYFSKGPIHLKNNVNLYAAEGALINFSTDPNDYLPVVYTRWEGVECFNYSPLIYAYEQENIALTGKGIFDAKGDYSNWWQWKGSSGVGSQAEARRKLFKMGENNEPVEKRIFGKDSYLRPNMVQFYKCRNILIDGPSFKNSPMWHIHPVLSDNITIKNINVTGHGPNNDGIDPESCRYVLIKNCYLDNGDDCITIKSGRNNDGRRVNKPSEFIIVQDCIMKDGHGGIVLGSEISGGARYIFAENCRMDSPNLDRALRIKTNSVRGGAIGDIYLRNINVGKVSGAAILMTMYYEEGDAGNFTPVIRNISIDSMTVENSQKAMHIEAYSRSPIENLKIENSSFKCSSEEEIYFSNVKNVIFNKVTINGKTYQTKK